MPNGQPPGPVKLHPTDALNKGLQKSKTNVKKPIASFKPGLNYGKKRDGGKY